MAWPGPTVPYNDLPPLPPTLELETHAVLKACIEARAALAELKQSCALIPNPTVLINAIPLLEAQASSEIENIVTTTDRLFRHANGGDPGDSATREALRYRTALQHGFQSLAEQPLCTRLAVELSSLIKDRNMDIRRIPGIALANDALGEVVYTPPVGEAPVRELLANWERFLHEATHLDPLVRMAAAHYQFEAIHPFIDGNGRTGRILNLLYLVEQGLLSLPVLYLSRYNVVAAGIGNRQTASSHLKQLCAIGVLEELAVGREKLFLHPRYLQLLNLSIVQRYPLSETTPNANTGSRR